MSGLDKLAEHGLDLQALQESSTAEILEWLPASGSKPDADCTVLLWLADNQGVRECSGWEAGRWDGEDWRLCESGGVVNSAECTVTHWAEANGPVA